LGSSRQILQRISDRFILGAGLGEATIRGFGSGDRIQLTGGISFADLTIAASGRDTQIKLGSDLIATLRSVAVSQVNSSLFG